MVVRCSFEFFFFFFSSSSLLYINSARGILVLGNINPEYKNIVTLEI